MQDPLCESDGIENEKKRRVPKPRHDRSARRDCRLSSREPRLPRTFLERDREARDENRKRAAILSETRRVLVSCAAKLVFWFSPTISAARHAVLFGEAIAFPIDPLRGSDGYVVRCEFPVGLEDGSKVVASHLRRPTHVRDRHRVRGRATRNLGTAATSGLPCRVISPTSLDNVIDQGKNPRSGRAI
jgi:hypothetical protein